MANCNCPAVDGTQFDGKEADWSGKAFFFTKTPLLFHIPIRIGKDIPKVIEQAKAKGYAFGDEAMLMQQDGLFSGKVLLEIEKPETVDPNVMTMPAGTRATGSYFLGPWSKLSGPSQKLCGALKAQGKQAKAVYFWYLTCPECSKERGYQTVLWGAYS